MNLSSVFSTQLPLGRITLLAWFTATFLSLGWGIEIAIRDVSPLEFVLQAGVLFGYYIVLMIFIRLALLIPVAIISNWIAYLVLDRDAKRTEQTSRSDDPRNPPEGYHKMNEDESEKKTLRALNPMVIDKLRGTGWQSFQKRIFDITANLADIIAMFTAFIMYSEKNLERLAPVGIVIALFLFVFGGFDELSTRGSNDSKAAG